ncbi:MAG: hypothetical protein A3E84_02465 [Gammaproteobacteria bacterium RIFCSPHIGHO2_12_FULL_42_13]|nr:MAG: hypothetical protein A3E84_02465 [Gammaproteobacteria bacterium RIFCSPHIGHO2_12_FULL_42_13]
MQNNKWIPLICALIIGLGIFGAGYCVGKSLFLARVLNRTVTVKGLAERDVKSDLGVWEINYREIGDNLVDINKNLQRDQIVVVGFLKQNGFTDLELILQPVKVEDRLANVYSSSGATSGSPAPRYVVTSGIRVRSARVEVIQRVSRLTGVLLQQGLSLSFDGVTLSPNPSYYFTKLDDIRPEMLAETTRSARLVAEQFAKDSGTKLGGIQHATQGVFQIMSTDTSTMSADWNSNQSALGSIDKKVRLVTTIDYRLK